MPIPQPLPTVKRETQKIDRWLIIPTEATMHPHSESGTFFFPPLTREEMPADELHFRAAGSRGEYREFDVRRYPMMNPVKRAETLRLARRYSTVEGDVEIIQPVEYTFVPLVGRAIDDWVLKHLEELFTRPEKKWSPTAAQLDRLLINDLNPISGEIREMKEMVAAERPTPTIRLPNGRSYCWVVDYEPECRCRGRRFDRPLYDPSKHHTEICTRSAMKEAQERMAVRRVLNQPIPFIGWPRALMVRIMTARRADFGFNLARYFPWIGRRVAVEEVVGFGVDNYQLDRWFSLANTYADQNYGDLLDLSGIEREYKPAPSSGSRASIRRPGECRV